MNYPLTGYHHITACAGGAQEDVEFFTQVVGLRMAKQTVLMDGSIPIYHLYYSNANLEPGSVMTTFPYGRKQGRKGSGQVSATAFTVPKGTLPFWKEHFKKRNVDQDPVAERFGQSFIRFRHPSGLAFEVIEDSADQREGWTTPEISRKEAAHGFHGAVLSVREVEETERFFTEALGFRKTGADKQYHRFETGSGGANKTVTLLHEPDRPAGSWTFGAGTVHHIALWPSRRRSTRNSAIPTPPRSRTGSTSTRCIAGVPAESWSRAAATLRSLSRKTKPRKNWAANSTCLRGLKIAVPKFLPRLNLSGFRKRPWPPGKRSK
jgi:catechol 2,3-dioxygenase-like lactoylglutathione lyase family enzyme